MSAFTPALPFAELKITNARCTSDGVARLGDIVRGFIRVKLAAKTLGADDTLQFAASVDDGSTNTINRYAPTTSGSSTEILTVQGPMLATLLLHLELQNPTGGALLPTLDVEVDSVKQETLKLGTIGSGETRVVSPSVIVKNVTAETQNIVLRVRSGTGLDSSGHVLLYVELSSI